MLTCLCKVKTVKRTNRLQVACLNTRSVKNKTVSINDYIVSNNFDAIALTETWLGSTFDKICINELVPDGYNVKHSSRKSAKRGVGVALIYKSPLTCTKAKAYSKYT